jgi:hypothetical protein
MFFSMSMLLLAAAVIPADLPTFQRDVSPAILAARPCDAKHWRQIEPAVHHLALQHADRLAALDDGARTACELCGNNVVTQSEDGSLHREIYAARFGQSPRYLSGYCCERFDGSGCWIWLLFAEPATAISNDFVAALGFS